MEGSAEATPERPPESVEEAMRRARQHARAAAAELAAAISALLDAGSLLASGRVAADTPFAPLQHGLVELRRRVEPGSVRDGASLLRSVADALDAEIERWETRSRSDPEARTVLRAFLGVRELLWELGVRGSGEAAEATTAHEPDEKETATRTGDPPEVQRVAVEG